jgi:3-deoxy-alpha-D-manno-octulosonate 8-oxidase|tara:strand:- start:24296 stop:25399 length:1104 start_codon:yes stop_codon:yes gene_type:complete
MIGDLLITGIKNVRNIQQYIIGNGALSDLPNLLEMKRNQNNKVVFFIDEFYKDKNIEQRIGVQTNDKVIFISTHDEPTTGYIDSIIDLLKKQLTVNPVAVVGMGGGITMDTTKAVSNLLTNNGRAKDYQGWDLVKNPAVYKIAIPTISGTGAEATRTCVMTNQKTGLKLGMNSDYTVFDQIIMDPDLTITVPRNQYFYTGMDAYIHCIEALNGSYRNPIGDAYSAQTLSLCREIFFDDEMMSNENRSKLMVASYLGGCAIATSYVGVIHPFSAALSVVLGLHHCVANCITMRAMNEFYPDEYSEFWSMVEKQSIVVPIGVSANLTDEQFQQLYSAMIVHERPLTNALGNKFKSILTKNKVIELYMMM